MFSQKLVSFSHHKIYKQTKIKNVLSVDCGFLKRDLYLVIVNVFRIKENKFSTTTVLLYFYFEYHVSDPVSWLKNRLFGIASMFPSPL